MALHVRTAYLLLFGGLVLLGCASSAPPEDEPPSAESAGEAEEKATVPANANGERDRVEVGEPPDGFTIVEVVQVVSTEQGHAVLLLDDEKTTLLPIFIGPSQALTIQLRLERRRFSRPLTHDLLEEIVEQLGGDIAKVHIDGLKSGVFVGTVYVEKNGRLAKIDSRASDAIALALGDRVPIFVSDKVLKDAGIRKEDLEKEELDDEEIPGQPPKSPPTKPL